MTQPRCLYGIIPSDRGPRCQAPSVPGFDYCAAHGERLGAFLLQMCGEREAILNEHKARLAKTRRETT